LKYHCSYCIREWNSCTKKGFSSFSPSHTKMNGYCHHQIQFLNSSEHYHCQSDSYKFGVVCFDDDNTCNDNCRSKQGTILHIMSIRRWFHSPSHKTYDCFHLRFDSFFTSCVHACITHHQQTSLVFFMFISHYRQWVSIALQHVQTIVILL
jgi:hypothetical protein